MGRNEGTNIGIGINLKFYIFDQSIKFFFFLFGGEEATVGHKAKESNIMISKELGFRSPFLLF